MPDDVEFIADDEEHLSRMRRLYEGLTEDERHYIVFRWDHENGLEDWQQRLTKKEQAPLKSRVRKAWLSVGAVAAIGLLSLFISLNYDYGEAKEARKRLQYIYARR